VLCSCVDWEEYNFRTHLASICWNVNEYGLVAGKSAKHIYTIKKILKSLCRPKPPWSSTCLRPWVQVKMDRKCIFLPSLLTHYHQCWYSYLIFACCIMLALRDWELFKGHYICIFLCWQLGIVYLKDKLILY
jgi:hypothetical protein